MSYTALKRTTPIAKKKHLCSWCGQTIQPGEQYRCHNGVYDGDFQTTKFHFECDAAFEKECKEWGYDYEFMPYDNPRPPKLTT